MNKIAIITMIGNNYGNRLQNYALQEYLKKINCKYDVETIYNDKHDYPTQKTNIIKLIKKIGRKVLNLYIKIKYFNTELKRKQCFNQFNKDFIKFSKEKYNIDTLDAEYDYFIVGSDQVWNPYAYRNKELDFLNFSPKSKNISYAVSLGVDSLDKQFIQVYKKGMKNFNYISVRENEGKKIVKQLTERKDIEVLVDPTMLMTEKEWNSLVRQPKVLIQKKYILNYFLGKLSPERNKEIKRIARENGWEIINILDKKKSFYETGPSEFLYLEKNASLICTDSFHSCIFAILFNRPFVVFNREDKMVNMNSRIKNLLSKFNLQERYYKGKIDEKLLTADYTEAYYILEQERQKSFNFLKKALNIEENNSENKN